MELMCFTNLYVLMKTHTHLSISTYLLLSGFSQTTSLGKDNLTGMGNPCHDKCHEYSSALLTPSWCYKQDSYFPDVNLVPSPGTLWLSLGASSHWGQDCFLPHPKSPCRSCFSHTGSPWAPSTSSHREWDEMTVLPQKQWDLLSPLLWGSFAIVLAGFPLAQFPDAAHGQIFPAGPPHWPHLCRGPAVPLPISMVGGHRNLLKTQSRGAPLRSENQPISKQTT